jgi:hypothetical protein
MRQEREVYSQIEEPLRALFDGGRWDDEMARRATCAGHTYKGGSA